MKKFFIIIVNWNGEKDTLACLASLGKLRTKGLELRTLVVDNGSSDGSVVSIRNKFPEVDVIEMGKNLGFAGGNNVGIRRALERKVDMVWILNNDTIVDREALSMIDVFQDPNVGIAGSKIYFAKGREYHKDRYTKGEQGKILWYAGGLIDWDNMYASHRGVDEVDRGLYDKIEQTPFVTGCSMVIRREVLQRIGLFDERFYLYFEDVDFCLRAARAGFKNLYVPTSVVWHLNAGSSAPGSEVHQYYQTRNRMLLGMRYAPLRTKFALIREAIRLALVGKPIIRRAILDWILCRYGRME